MTHPSQSVLSKPFFHKVQQHASKTTWSHAVSWSRRSIRITCQKQPHEWEIWLTPPHGGTRINLWLFPDDLDWSCDCDSTEEVCVHVACAVIHLTQGKNNLSDTDEQTSTAGSVDIQYLGYAFQWQAQSFRLTRFLHSPETAPVPWQKSLRFVKHSSEYEHLCPTAADEHIDALLYALPHPEALLPTKTLHSIIRHLIDSPRITLNGQQVQVVPPHRVEKIEVKTQAQGLTLRTTLEPSVQTLPQNTALRTHNGKAEFFIVEPLPIGENWQTALRKGWFFPKNQYFTFFHEIRPTLLQAGMKIPLPAHIQPIERATYPLFLVLEAQPLPQNRLCLTPHLEYGSPPIARVSVDGTLNILQEECAWPVRNDTQERYWQSLVQQEGLSLSESKLYPAHLSGDMLMRWLQHHKQHPQTLLLTGAAWPEQPHVLQLAPQKNQEGLAFALKDSATSQSLSLHEVWQAFTHGAEYLWLEHGEFATLPKAFLEQHREEIDWILSCIDEHRGYSSQRTVTASSELWFDDLPSAPEREMPSDALPENCPEYALWNELRAYQHDGVRFLWQRLRQGIGCLLADDMGLGKTIQTLALLQGHSLVIAPKSVVHVWAEQTQRFRPDIPCFLYTGSKRTLDHLESTSSSLTITSYGVLKRDVSVLAQPRWQWVILDEAQWIKNPRSQNAKAAHRLQAHARLALSGTPIENHLGELWSIGHFLNPGIFGSFQHFQQYFIEPIEQQQHHKALQLHRCLRRFTLRRLKKDVAQDLPARTYIEATCTFSAEERQLYEQIRASSVPQALKFLQDKKLSPLRALETLLRLRQACCHANLIPGLPPTAYSSKLHMLETKLMPLVEEGHKVLIFSQWTRFLDLIGHRLSQMAINWVRLDGRTVAREKVVNRFQKDSAVQVMLISLKAGGTGLTLTAADHVFLMDLWWNPAVEAQAVDRVHRIGQSKPVFIHRVWVKDTIEERMLKLQHHKDNLQRLFLTGLNEGIMHSNFKMTRADVMSLLTT